MKDYTFEKFERDLDNGYQIFFTYVRNKYVVFKTSENSYTQRLITDYPKNPQPRVQIVTHKRIFEMFPFMEEFEYKIDSI